MTRQEIASLINAVVPRDDASEIVSVVNHTYIRVRTDDEDRFRLTLDVNGAEFRAILESIQAVKRTS